MGWETTTTVRGRQHLIWVTQQEIESTHAWKALQSSVYTVYRYMYLAQCNNNILEPYQSLDNFQLGDPQ